MKAFLFAIIAIVRPIESLLMAAIFTLGFIATVSFLKKIDADPYASVFVSWSALIVCCGLVSLV